jgi:glycosyltransferase involved in cell wall biosynthesis
MSACNRQKNDADVVVYTVVMLLEEIYDGFLHFIENLVNVFKQKDASYEILIIANGTERHLKNELGNIDLTKMNARAFAFNKKISQAVCIKAALAESRGRVIVVCGSYQQISNESLLKLLVEMDNGADIVVPLRTERVDPAINRLQSRIFNYMVSKIMRSGPMDLSCTVKLFRREVLESQKLYGNMFRFLPILAAEKGYKTKAVYIEHYQEKGKTGLYGFYDYWTRVVDIVTVYFNTRFIRKPLRFFSTIGVIFMIAGSALLFFLFAEKVLFDIEIGDRRGLILSVSLLVFGVQTTSVGLLGEIIAFTHGRLKTQYSIEKKI